MHPEPALAIGAAILCRCGDRVREVVWAHPERCPERLWQDGPMHATRFTWPV